MMSVTMTKTTQVKLKLNQKSNEINKVNRGIFCKQAASAAATKHFFHIKTNGSN